jgi:hypothetical protein
MGIRKAGIDLLKGNFGNAIKSFVTADTIAPATYRSDGNFWFWQQDGKEIHYQYGNLTSSLLAYQGCPPLAAIVNRKAQSFINGKTLLTNLQGKAKGKEATGDVATRLRSLLKRPNPLQSWKQFEAQNYIYQQLTGFCVTLPIKPVGFDPTYATAIWNIPPWMIEYQTIEKSEFIFSTSLKDFIKSIRIRWGGYSTELPLDDIYIFQDFTPSLNSVVFAESRVRANQQVISNIIGTYESRGVLIDKRGPSYIISSAQGDESGNIALTTAEKAAVEEDFKKFGLRKKQIQAIITSAAIKVQTVGFSTRDLMMFEEIEDDIMRLCDAYVFPYQLMASGKGTTFANVNDAKKLLYQDAIMPEAETIYEQWNQFFNLPVYGLELTKNYKHIAALQEDQVQQATARFNRNRACVIEFQNNVLTLNEWRELNGDDPLDNGLGELYYYELLDKGVRFAQGTSGASNPDQQVSDNQNNDQGSGSATSN